MNKRVALLAITTTLLAAPALPCSLAIDDVATAALIQDGDRDVPTRVHVAFSAIGVIGQVVVDEADAEDDGATPVAAFPLNGESGLRGELILEPSRRYTMTDPSLVEPITFTTGAGEDTTPPDPPTVELDVIQRGPEIGLYVDSCGGGGVQGGFTVVDVLVAADADVVGVLAKDPDTGDMLKAGKDVLSFRSGDAGTQNINVVAVDRAGNESAPVPVTLDFGGPGGCSQVRDTAPAALSLIGLALLRRRRRQ